MREKQLKEKMKFITEKTHQKTEKLTLLRNGGYLFELSKTQKNKMKEDQFKIKLMVMLEFK